MSKKPKAILAIDSSAFETFVKLHLPTTVADVIILTLGIKTFAGFLQCNSLEEQLLSLYDDLSTDDKSYWYMHHTGVHTVKPNLLNEIKLFREACETHMNKDKTNRNNPDRILSQLFLFIFVYSLKGSSSSTQDDSESSASASKCVKRKNNFDRRACTDRANNTNDDLQFKDTQIRLSNTSYVEQQFENSKLQQDGNITGKVKWFISFIKTLDLRPSGYNDE
ncbi:unnamed protein product [Rotaria sordida]|uniref:Uncharacterized protein n=1 Tax=Rotaria sordida TaxID=392033 RepID=A0A819C9Q4_9BILA|nr:unnamed protein product [Rotaria sordida]